MHMLRGPAHWQRGSQEQVLSSSWPGRRSSCRSTWCSRVSFPLMRPLAGSFIGRPVASTPRWRLQSLVSSSSCTLDPAAGVLRISQELREQEDLMAEVSRIFLSVTRFRTFTMSRWDTAGASFPCLRVAWELGLSQLASMCREDKHTSQYIP